MMLTLSGGLGSWVLLRDVKWKEVGTHTALDGLPGCQKERKNLLDSYPVLPKTPGQHTRFILIPYPSCPILNADLLKWSGPALRDSVVQWLEQGFTTGGTCTTKGTLGGVGQFVWHLLSGGETTMEASSDGRRFGLAGRALVHNSHALENILLSALNLKPPLEFICHQKVIWTDFCSDRCIIRKGFLGDFSNNECIGKDMVTVSLSRHLCVAAHLNGCAFFWEASCDGGGEICLPREAATTQVASCGLQASSCWHEQGLRAQS